MIAIIKKSPAILSLFYLFNYFCVFNTIALAEETHAPHKQTPEVYFEVQSGTTITEDQTISLAESVEFGTIMKSGGINAVNTSNALLKNNGNNDNYVFRNGLMYSVNFGLMFNNFTTGLEFIHLSSPAEDDNGGNVYQNLYLDGVIVDGKIDASTPTPNNPTIVENEGVSLNSLPTIDTILTTTHPDHISGLAVEKDDINNPSSSNKNGTSITALLYNGQLSTHISNNILFNIGAGAGYGTINALSTKVNSFVFQGIANINVQASDHTNIVFCIRYLAPLKFQFEDVNFKSKINVSSYDNTAVPSGAIPPPAVTFSKFSGNILIPATVVQKYSTFAISAGLRFIL